MDAAAAAARGEGTPQAAPKLIFGDPEPVIVPAPEQVNSPVPQIFTADNPRPEGEFAHEGNLGMGTGTGKAKIFSQGRMIVDRQASREQRNAIKEQIKSIAENPELKQKNARDEWDDALTALNKGGKQVRPVTAEQAYNAIQQHHDIVKSYMDSLPQRMLDKAALHESAAKTIEALDPSHPEIAKQRNLATALRTLAGGTDDIRNKLREAKSEVLGGGSGLDKNLDYQLNVKNKLVQAMTSFGLLKKGQPNFTTREPSVIHPAIKKAHDDIKSVVSGLNSFLRPVAMKVPVSTAKLTIWGRAIDAMQTPNKNRRALDLSSFQEPHPDYTADPDNAPLSKPGYMWGEVPALDINNKLHQRILKGAKDTREREQIPLKSVTDDTIKATYGAGSDIHRRYKAAMNSLKESVVGKPQETDKDLIDPVAAHYTPNEDERALDQREKTALAEYSTVAQKKRDLPGAPKVTFSDTSTPGNNARTMRQRANTAAVSLREGIDAVKHHTDVATESLIAGNPVPQETVDFIAQHPEGNKIREAATRYATAHVTAVSAYKAGKSPDAATKAVLKTKGLQRAKQESRTGK